MIEEEAERVSVGTELVAANNAAEIEPILARLGPDAGVIFNSDSFVLRNLKLAIDLSAKYRVPAMYGTAGMGNTGGLIASSLDLPTTTGRQPLTLTESSRARSPLTFRSSSQQDPARHQPQDSQDARHFRSTPPFRRQPTR